MDNLKVYESTKDFYIYDKYFPKGTKAIVDNKYYCIVPAYIAPFEMLKRGQFKEINQKDIEEMVLPKKEVEE